MVGYRQPFPIRHKCVLRSAQHRADIVSVVIRRIKIGVIANARRQLHRHLVLFVERARAQFGVVAQSPIFGGQ